jgi:hypothetical protein
MTTAAIHLIADVSTVVGSIAEAASVDRLSPRIASLE